MIINKYPYGSHVYNTVNSESDKDYIVIVSDDTDISQLSEKDITYIKESNFLVSIMNNDIVAMECLCLSKDTVEKLGGYITKEYPYIIDKHKLRKSISTVSSNSYVKAKKKLTVLTDYNLKQAYKSLFHSLRILMFGKQLALYNKITDYSEANYLLFDIVSSINGKSHHELWEYYDSKYRKVFNTLKSEFKLAAPIDESENSAIKFAIWIADNKWYKQIKYDRWEKIGSAKSLTSLELFNLFLDSN